MDPACRYCGRLVTPDEVTRSVCARCGAVLPHAVRAHDQALAFPMMPGVPVVGPSFVPPPRSSSAVLIVILVGVLVVFGSAGAMVFFLAARPSRPVTAIALHACRERASLRSQNSDVATTLTITNDATVAVSISWLDTYGKSIFYARLKPGESYVQPTYATHPWLVEDANGACQGIFVARESGAHTVSLAAVRAAR